MTINDQIRDEKLQYDINREAAKILALSSGKLLNLIITQKPQLYLMNLLTKEKHNQRVT